MNIATRPTAPDTQGLDLEACSRGLFIGGAWLAGNGPHPIPVVDPSTEAVIAHVANADLADAAAAVDAASKAAPVGRRRRPGSAPKSCDVVSS